MDTPAEHEKETADAGTAIFDVQIRLRPDEKSSDATTSDGVTSVSLRQEFWERLRRIHGYSGAEASLASEYEDRLRGDFARNLTYDIHRYVFAKSGLRLSERVNVGRNFPQWGVSIRR
ncbi:hypothetical protein [Paraburkholderia sp. CNPSo 3281]|uniref:hypothetical protein n=1 Tax=Paraburkholderia sp. CNPSo 3281 TaxID=2940933 RepID=UPI0020B77118|nr:hypothetical protein [Paraburkholderia sp. CNPSo 3281]MCP3720815.1 hypothetical protein [Paraburkholderia sp. CNPSo 3281]